MGVMTIFYHRVLEQTDPLAALIVTYRWRTRQCDDFILSTDPWRHGRGRTYSDEAPLLRLARLRLYRMTRRVSGSEQERLRAGCADFVELFITNPQRWRGELLRTCINGPLRQSTAAGTPRTSWPWDVSTLLTIGGAVAATGLASALVSQLTSLVKALGLAGAL